MKAMYVGEEVKVLRNVDGGAVRRRWSYGV